MAKHLRSALYLIREINGRDLYIKEWKYIRRLATAAHKTIKLQQATYLVVVVAVRVLPSPVCGLPRPLEINEQQPHQQKRLVFASSV